MSLSSWIIQNQNTLYLLMGAFATLGLYSVLYRENRLYRLCEHVFLGVATGYAVAFTWNNVLEPYWFQPIWNKGEWWLAALLFPGLLYYCVFSKTYNWMARLIIGFYMGIAAGQGFQAFVNDLWPQIAQTFRPLWPHAAFTVTPTHKAIPAVGLTQAFANFLFLVILLCVLTYFFFAFEQKNKAVRGASQVGRWVMMLSFGAIFGLTMMARLALLIDRMYFLLFEVGALPWLHTPSGRPSWVIFGILMGLVVLVLVLAHVNKPDRV
jgi:hypothetical protein